MHAGRVLALAVGICMFVAAAALVVDRGGLLAWIGVVAALLVLLKILRWPARHDASIALATLGVWAIAWGGTWSYVVSTWESGEVVELDVAGGHTARVWVLDMSDKPVMYYDAPPDVAGSLLAGARLTVTRNGRVSQGCADAARVDGTAEVRLQEVFSRMEEKYKERNRATEIFYSVLGGRRDRVAVLMELTPCT